jgi:hypothetical protein
MRRSAAVRWSSVEADPRAGLTVSWTRGSEAAVIAGHAHRGTGGALSWHGRWHAGSPKVSPGLGIGVRTRCTSNSGRAMHRTRCMSPHTPPRSPPDPADLVGVARGGGAHRHDNRSRQRSCRAARRDRRRRGAKAHSGVRECAAGVEARHAAGRSSPRRPAAPIRRWLRRPASCGPPSARPSATRPAGPARVIAMRAQGEAEVAIEQGETRFEE